MSGFSKIGFILATLGSSIGLGHIWRFPYMAGTNGGGAFVLLFLALTLIAGIAMLIGEMLIGNYTQKNTARWTCADWRSFYPHFLYDCARVGAVLSCECEYRFA